MPWQPSGDIDDTSPIQQVKDFYWAPVAALHKWKGLRALSTTILRVSCTTSILLITLTNNRYYQQGTQKAVDVKRVPKADTEALAGLFDNEVAALKAANAFGIRRVSTFLEEAFCENGDRCLVLK